MAICRRRYAPHLCTVGPVNPDARSPIRQWPQPAKRVISGRLTMPMTRYNRARKMRRSSHASPAATGARLAQPTPWSVHPAVGARRLRWHEDLPANHPDQDIWFERWPEPSSPSSRLPQRTATGARHATGIGLPGRAPKYQETHPDQSADTQQSLAMLYGPGWPRPRAATSPRPDHRVKGVA